MKAFLRRRFPGWLWLVIALTAGGATAEPFAHGLAWNRTGLPLVFPLRVTTEAGQNYYLTLHDPDKGAAVFAAFIEGGRFFRVLAPPGRYAVRLAAGKMWQGEDALFGPGSRTTRIQLSAPLVFKVADFSTKAGHVIDLTERDADGRLKPDVTAAHICQGLHLEVSPRRQLPFDDDAGYASRLPPRGEVVRHPDARFDPARRIGRDAPAFPTRYAPYYSAPRYGLRGRPC